MTRHPWIALAIVAASPLLSTAEQPAVSSVPTQTVYEFQLNYQLPWQRWYGGPGLSLGGTMPTQGAYGYSSLNGIPFPAPLGAGVYVNTPAPHASVMPGAFPGAPFPAGVVGGPGGMAPGGMAPGFAGPGMLGPGAAMGMPGMVPRMNGLSPAGYQQQSPQANQVASPRQKVVMASAPAARRMSVEQQNRGDEKLRQQLWSQAYVAYRNAVDLAPDRPEAHFRLGLAFTALKQYASAIREFKRSLELDPSLPQSGDKLSTIFGADDKSVQSILLPSVADWAREDLRDSDRLFLLGLMLHYNDDPRGSEILESAMRAGGQKEYIMAFLNPEVPGDRREPATRPRTQPVPTLSNDVESTPYGDDIPPAPIPSTFGPTPIVPGSPTSTGPVPEPPPT